jgi:peptidoglycan hydrolase-like protein with peptidoglycan-binding domain
MKYAQYIVLLVFLLPAITIHAQTVQKCPVITKYLSSGSRDAQVVVLKKYLVAEGYLSNVSMTNYFGPSTEAALKRWQKAKGVVLSGTPRTTGYGAIGPKTRAALKNCKIITVASASENARTALTPQTQIVTQPSSVLRAATPVRSAGSLCVAETQTRTTACPAAQTGTIVETRIAACPEKTWSVWVETSRTCSSNAQVIGIEPVVAQPPTITPPPQTSIPPQPPAAQCIFNTKTLTDGESVTAYQAASVPYGSSCISEVRRCMNGGLSGSYSFDTCSVAALTCEKPRYYRFTEPASKSLLCTTYTPLFGDGEIVIPDTGFAFVRARFTPANRATTQEGAGVASEGVYSWGAQIIFNASPFDVYKTSEAMCPGSSPEQHVAYGWIDKNAGTNRIRIEGTAIRTNCIPGRLNVFGGRVLEVWVEDPKPECQKKDIIAYTSWRDVAYGTIQQPLKVRNHGPIEVKFGWVWPSSLTQLPNTSLSIPTALPGRTRLKLYSSIEGSPFDTPQLACGAQTSTAQFVLKDGENNFELQRLQQTLPSGTGITHMNFGHTYEVTGPDALRARQFSLFAGTDAPSMTDIYTGGNAGQVTIGVIRD